MTEKIKNSKTLGLINEKVTNLASYRLNDLTSKFAFTLAEVLITLAIIGVVAALTIPNLLANFQSKQFDSGDKVFYNKLNEALRIMNTQQVLAGHGTTEKFVTELQKHLKIAKVCSDTPTDCFTDKITWGENEIDLSYIKNSNQFAIGNWGTNVIGIQFANGMSALLAYNPKCNPDPYSNQANVMECVAVMYDTNAFTTPNQEGKDIRVTSNVKTDGFGCVAKTNSICTITAPFLVNSYLDCSDTTQEDYKYCQQTGSDSNFKTDYRAGALRDCAKMGGTLPTLAQLAEIATDIYGTTIDGTYRIPNITMDTNNSYGIKNGMDIWAIDSEGNWAKYPRELVFRNNETTRTIGGYQSVQDTTKYAICVK